jgi:hypothetical protein
MASLDSVLQKIFRATVHMKELETELDGYFQTNPGKAMREPNTPDNVAVFTFQPKGPIPSRFGLIVGDALQNFRSALDYLVWELVLAENNQPGEHNMFPICSTADAFKNAVAKRKRLLGIHPDAITEIERLQPYHLGQDWEKSILAVLDALVNVNKHRRVLLTEMGSTHRPEPIFEKDGELWMSFGPGPTPVYDSNTKFGPYPVIDGKVIMDTQLVAVITFSEGAAKGMEITLSLNVWGTYIKDTLIPIFHKFFA